MLPRFFKGLFSPIKSATFAASHPGLWFYMALPMTVAVLFLLGFWQFWGLLEQTVLDYFGIASTGTLNWLIEMFSLLLFGVIAFFAFTATGMILASPFNDLLCQKVLRLRGWNFVDPPFFKGAFIAVADACKILLFKIPLLILSLFFPPIAFPIFAFIVVLDHFDYPWSHQVQGFRPRVGCFGRDLPETLGFGISFGFLFAIPFLGLLVLPLSVIGASLLAQEGAGDQRGN